jgi:hypothetical protein
MKNMIQLEQNNLRELSFEETEETNGGFFPIVIWGTIVAAEYVAAAFFVGVGVGAAVAQGQK